MVKKFKLFLYPRSIYKIILGFVIIFIYLPWFNIFKSLSSGDWPYLYKENIESFTVFTQPPFLWLEPYYNLTAKIGSQLFFLRWEIIEKLFWFYPFLIIGSVSSWLFIELVLSGLNVSRFRQFFTFLGCIIFMGNTYILMVVGGGQMGVGLSYALSPLVLYSYFRVLAFKKIEIKKIVFFSVPFVFQLMFDPRIFLTTFLVIVTHFSFSTFLLKDVKFSEVKKIIFILVFTSLGNLFWIIPNLGFFQNRYSEVASAANASFLSFANFSNTISFLHPNWPENIFGKIGFMKPEFIFIAVFAYSFLLFVKTGEKNESRKVLYFVLLGLFGAFFAKGVNPPMGFIYELFSKIPGSTLFRDPTKFYIWISLAYSILIPFSAFSIYNFLDKKFKSKHIGYGFLIVVVFYFLILISPAFSGKLTGTFSPGEVPGEYIELKNFIISSKDQFNTLWVPTTQRFGPSLGEHSAISAQDLFYLADVASTADLFKNSKIKGQLKEADVKYVIVPYDPIHEIFIKDRKYNKNLYSDTVNILKKISWLSLLTDSDGRSKFGNIVVFKILY